MTPGKGLDFRPAGLTNCLQSITAISAKFLHTISGPETLWHTQMFLGRISGALVTFWTEFLGPSSVFWINFCFWTAFMGLSAVFVLCLWHPHLFLEPNSWTLSISGTALCFEPHLCGSQPSFSISGPLICFGKPFWDCPLYLGIISGTLICFRTAFLSHSSVFGQHF